MTIKKFDAEIGKVLHLMINSIYTNKDIFLRELISNASDACEKKRHQVLQDVEQEGNYSFCIEISIDKRHNTITIQDNGIGMSASELDKNLGTIAHSGTKIFMDNLNLQGDSTKNSQIGQFGVGFYSAFMVAESVEVISKKSPSEAAHIWQSNGHSEYEITPLPETSAYDINSSGTKIVLHIKPECSEYLEEYKIRHIVKIYSDNITFPVYLLKANGEKEQINTAEAIWLRPKSEISTEQYDEFYKLICHMPGSPWSYLHFTCEGKNSFTALLYIPGNRPYDLFNPERATRAKLYVHKVFITDSAAILPAYLRFVRGIVDSEDLPLNISRETLQNNHLISQMRRNIVKRILKSLKDIAANDKEKYKAFWQNFGEVMKEGLCEGALEEKEELLEVCRFKSTKSGNDLISLDEYISNMQDGQNEIYFFSCEADSSFSKSPQLEGFLKRRIEVILLSDQVDDFWVNVIHQYKNNLVKSVNTASADPGSTKSDDSSHTQGAANEDLKGKNAAIIAFCKKVLSTKVKDVIISNKLTESPACITVPDGSMSTKMEKMLIEQRQLTTHSAKILELNPNHTLVRFIGANCDKEEHVKEAETILNIIFSSALLTEGQTLHDPFAYVQNVNEMLSKLIA